MGTYEKHKQICMDLSDTWITKLVVEDKQELDLNKVELLKASEYQCDLIKILLRRLELHRLAYPNIMHDKNNNIIRWKTDKEIEEDEDGGKAKLSLDDSITTGNSHQSKKQS